jgi:hypothetical protein
VRDRGQLVRDGMFQYFRRELQKSYQSVVMDLGGVKGRFLRSGLILAVSKDAGLRHEVRERQDVTRDGMEEWGVDPVKGAGSGVVGHTVTNLLTSSEETGTKW